MSDDWPLTNEKYQRAGEVLDAEIGDELVALDVAAGECFGFNEVARTVWRELAEPKSFEQLRDRLLAEYDVGVAQCTAELKQLIEDLVSQGLLKKSSIDGI